MTVIRQSSNNDGIREFGVRPTGDSRTTYKADQYRWQLHNNGILEVLTNSADSTDKLVAIYSGSWTLTTHQ